MEGKKLQRSFRVTLNHFRPAPAADKKQIKARKEEDQSYSATSVCWARSWTQKTLGRWALGRETRLGAQIRSACSAPRTFYPLQGSWQLEPGLWIPHLPFCTNFLSRFALELYPCPSGYFYLRKQKSFSQKTCFQIKLMRLVLTPKATLFLFHSI